MASIFEAAISKIYEYAPSTNGMRTLTQFRDKYTPFRAELSRSPSIGSEARAAQGQAIGNAHLTSGSSRKII